MAWGSTNPDRDSGLPAGGEGRYDGGHKRDAYLVETLGRFVERVPVCPEVEMGLGMPRETLRLGRLGRDVRMMMPKTGADHTEAMQSFAKRRLHVHDTEMASWATRHSRRPAFYPGLAITALAATKTVLGTKNALLVAWPVIATARTRCRRISRDRMKRKSPMQPRIQGSVSDPMTVNAKYEDGVFKPLEEVKISEATVVEVRIPTYSERLKNRARSVAEFAFYGMWKDRTDIGDSVEYVSNLRG